MHVLAVRWPQAQAMGSNSLQQDDGLDGVDDAVGRLHVRLLHLAAADGGAAGEGDLDLLASQGLNLHALLQLVARHRAVDDVALEDLAQVGQAHQLQLCDAQLLGGSNEGVVVGREQGERARARQSAGEASLCGRDAHAQWRVRRLVGASAADRGRRYKEVARPTFSFASRALVMALPSMAKLAFLDTRPTTSLPNALPPSSPPWRCAWNVGFYQIASWRH